MKNSSVAIAILALCGSTAAQEVPLPRLSDLIDAPQKTVIDLDGVWQSLPNDKNPSGPLSLKIEHQGNRIWVIEALQGSEDYGKKLLAGTYSGQSAFVMKFEPDPSGAVLRDVQIKVLDPDSLLLNDRTVDRISLPRLNDIPCDPQNVFHVSAEGAISRAAVAEKAEQYSTAFCWGMIAGKMGHRAGEYIVGYYLWQGLGLQKNVQLALQWMLASAKQGMFEAQRDLSQMYDRGEGTPVNYKQSAYWYLKATDTYIAEHQEEIAASAARGLDSNSSSYDAPGERKMHCVQGRGYGSDNRIRNYCSMQ